MSHRSPTSDKRARRFLPEPIETSSRSSRVHQAKFSSREISPLKQKCLRDPKAQSSLPQHSNDSHQIESVRRSQPVSDTFETNDVQSENVINGSQRSKDKPSLKPELVRENLPVRVEEPLLQDQNTAFSHPRKFQPQLVETGKRSFRRQETQHTSSFGKSIPQAVHRVSKPINIVRSPSADDVSNLSGESRFSYTSLRQRQETRRHSFRVPDLPAIPSSCSEASDVSGCSPGAELPLALLHQPALKSENNPQGHHEKEYSEYVLALAARSAEKQLKEQALAAFPNEQVYQPVDHFAIDKEDEDCVNEELQVRTKLFTSGRHRRASSADLPWELEYLRRHKEEAEMCDRAMAGTKGLHFPPIDHRPSDGATQSCGNWATGLGLTETRQGISPPMLGDDLMFPHSLSPETTICESGTFEHNHPKDKSSHPPGLWYANPHLFDSCDSGGLWMGTCKSNQFPNFGDSRSLCMHMNGDAGEHSSQCSTGMLTKPEKLPPGYPRDVQTLTQTRQHVSQDEGLDRELNDSFVTQIYNYLSLGYPCVARYYDHELSIVSGIPVADLRRDDLKTDAKGYVSVMNENSIDRRVAKGGCMRWMALRLYIHEWARKRPKMIEGDGDHGTWGVCERKGSWAI
ncbi:hypothetical protein BO78DRAFT_396494 [Aspergillus sclerotiicarbonarius CBS 121057]|uniref:Uncharacterized protein n=1 Tax=Aspergillus sclerotiicarbonarius (strain CBS 121057 / IBT 28362) TaxID=1448318 RepID=A0A319EBB9_ASPSB|nr:hypothetical protein BO78DRAFT_396494 [Aspergillus sclerotiicarbonarius CBS 121057]